MVQVTYFTACTLDGFIADQRHSLDWLFAVPDTDGTAMAELMAEVGSLVMGASTYRWVIGHHPELLDDATLWREWYADRPAWVFSHRSDLPRVPGADVRFVQGDVRKVYDQIADETGRGIWLVGGGDLVGQFDDAGLLDRIILGMCPVTLGAGAPLLPRRITSERLRLVDVRQTGQQARIELEVVRP